MSKDRYRDFLDQTNPSEELIKGTVNKMKEEQMKMNRKTGTRMNGTLPKAMAAAVIAVAALFLYASYRGGAGGPLLYSELDFSEPVVLEGVASEPYAGKIAPFSEDFLLEGDTFIVGTVIQSEEVDGRILHEIRVDENLKSLEGISEGEILLVEMETYAYTSLEGSVVGLKGNRQYVLPLVKLENGSYSIIYPFAPQIEVTNDGAYVLHEYYSSLIDESAREIKVDQPVFSSYFSGRMFLIESEDFLNRYISLVEQ